MFDDLRNAFRELLHGNMDPSQRRELLVEMRETLVRAKMALDDLRVGVATTEARLGKERAELDTVMRRKGLAEGINDQETVTIASRFEGQHRERVSVLERKLEVQQSELALLEREVEEMTSAFKAAQAGVGSGLRSGAVEDSLDDIAARDSGLERDLRSLDRDQRRAAHEADAEARLAELKRRMGR